MLPHTNTQIHTTTPRELHHCANKITVKCTL
uniref:Uncharacterized protein n=1 Tax=Anguilla anguilla TaxID=7936 RepID=A0A0E9T4A0_ANGAN